MNGEVGLRAAGGEKYASRISAACWNRRSVVVDSGRVMLVSLRHVQGFGAGVGERGEIGGEELVDQPIGRKQPRKIGERNVAVGFARDRDIGC